MSNSRFAGIGGHHSNQAQTVEWITPPSIIQALGGAQSFDLDPCAPLGAPWDCATRAFDTARWHYTVADNGLDASWWGRVWLNPPYTADLIGLGLARMAAHGRGTALIFARTETTNFFRHVWESASALLFLAGRINFHKPDGSLQIRKPRKPTHKPSVANSGAPSVLCAYGQEDADVLAFCGLNGAFVPLRFPRGILVQAINVTWSTALREWFAEQSGPVTLADLYRAFAGHPKARANPNFKAKLRQQLQHGPFRRVGRGQWAAAS